MAPSMNTQMASLWDPMACCGGLIKNYPMACCGGLIKNYEGQWVVGFAKPIAVASSIVAKLWALREGLSLCIEI